jgi:hypothetical protein
MKEKFGNNKKLNTEFLCYISKQKSLYYISKLKYKTIGEFQMYEKF